jgi:hypothetical protein
MPAKRPEADAKASWLCVQATREIDNLTAEDARKKVSSRLQGRNSNKRFHDAKINTEIGCIEGDTLSPDTLRRHVKTINRLRKADPAFRTETDGCLAELKSDIAARPGSWVAPYRMKRADCAVVEWTILQFWPAAADPEKTIRLHFPHGRFDLELAWSDEWDSATESERVR